MSASTIGSGAMELTRRLLRTPTNAMVGSSATSESRSSDEVPFEIRFANDQLLRVRFYGSGHEPTTFWSLMHTIQQLAMLPPNWDSYGADALSSTAVGRTMQLLPNLLLHNVPKPSVVPHPDGGLVLEWHTGGLDLEVAVPSSGPFTWTLARDDRLSEWIGTDVPSEVGEALLGLSR